ncbi:MAG TPA: LamG domain-containing protein, partial [Verrucomicrobiae bacterium]|nr:LamG domain-containing protein [Verrucomicrobiae bacterium]
MKTTNPTDRLALLWSCAALMAMMQCTAPAQTLVDRYSFNDSPGSTNVADSVGGQDGVLPNGGDFASVPGQLILLASSSQYVQLPANILSNYTAVTVDCWATFATLPVNCFLYGFGNTDGSGAGENYIFCQPENGRIAITGVDPGYTGEQGTGGAGNLSGQTVHITSVYNPVAGYVELYTNGVLVSANNAETVPMSSVSQVLNYIGRSLYTSDSYMDVELNEFRIWNGALNGLQVAGCDVAGPDTVGSAANAGTVTSLQLSVPSFQLTQGGNESGTVVAQTTALSYSVNVTRLVTLASGNTNIITINSTNNAIQAVGQGSTTVTATLGSVLSTPVTITVV